MAPPAFALPPPENTDLYGPYMPISDPYMSIADESKLKPIAVNEKADGSLEIIVGLPPYFGADEAHGVDIYVGISIPGFADVWQIIPDPPGIVSTTTGLAPWKTNVSDKIDDELVLELPAALLPMLPRGTYFVHVMVTPTGDASAYTAWSSYFVIDWYVISPFLIPLP